MSVIFFGPAELANVAVALQVKFPRFKEARLARLLAIISAANADAYNDSYAHHGENVQGFNADDIETEIRSTFEPDDDRAETTAALLAYNCVANNGTDYGLHPWAEMAFKELGDALETLKPTYSFA